MFNQYLKQIEKELSEHHRNHKQMELDIVSDRLNKSLEAYSNDLDSRFRNQAYRSELNILRKL